MNKYVRKGLKISAWTVGSVIGLFLLVVLLIQIPAVQDVVRGKAVRYLEDKIKTPVRIDRIEIGLPKSVIVEGIYLQDQQGDTLLAADKIALDISLFKLFRNEVEINSIDLQGITANVTRDKDSVFNFGYIIKAFDSGKPKDSTSEPMKISLRKVNLDRIDVAFADAVTRNDLKVKLQHFDTDIREFDLQRSHYDIPKITLVGLLLNLKQGELVREIGEKTATVADSLAKDPKFDIKLGELDFKRIAIRYDNQGTQLNSGIDLDRLHMKFNKTDIQKQDLDISAMELKGLSGGFTIGKPARPKQARDTVMTSKAANSGWNVKLDQVAIEQVNFRFDDENKAPTAKGIDYSHLALKDFRLKATRLRYGADVISGKVADFAMQDKSGVVIEAFRSDFYYGPKSAWLKDFYLKTPKTEVSDRLVATYPSLAALKSQPGELGIDARLGNSRVAFSDILLFAPDLEDTEPFRGNKDAVLFIDGRVKGRLRDLSIPDLEVSGIGETRIAASGRIIGLPDVSHAYFDLDIRQLRTSAKDIATFVPAGTIPENISLPELLSLHGKFKGKADNLNADLILESSYGNARVKAVFDQRSKNREKYDATVSLDDFDLGKLIRNDSIGTVSLRAKVKGTGLDPKTAVASVDGRILKAEFNGYAYRDLDLKGDIRNGRFNAIASMTDPNLSFDMVSSGNFSGKYPSLDLKLNIDMADLQRLNLYDGTLKLRGKIDADLASTDPDLLNGTVNAYHFVIANGKEQFLLDSVKASAETTADSTRLKLKSQFLNANADGKFKLTKIGPAISRTLSRFYSTKAPAEAREEDTGTQQLQFRVDVNNDPVLQKLLPELSRFEPMHFEGGYDSAKDSIAVNGDIPRLVYGSNTVSGVSLDIRTAQDSLRYAVRIAKIENQQFSLPNTTLSGSVKDNTASYDLIVKDEGGKDHYRIAGNLTAAEGRNRLHLDPEGLLLDYQNWSVHADNAISIADAGINAQHFELSNSGSRIELQSENDRPDAPMKLEFTDFELKTITEMVAKHSDGGFSLSGKLNGTAKVKELKTNPVFTSDLTIENLSVSKDTVGNVNIKVDNAVADTYRAHIALSGFGNQVDLDGNYRSDSKRFDLDLDLAQLQMKSVQAFTFGALKNSSGALRGKLRITGTAQDPDLEGTIRFDNAKFTVTELNSAFTIDNDKLQFTNEGIVFDRFALVDEQQNQLRINGKVLTRDYRDFGFDLKIRANDFRAVNSSEKDNDLFYGKLFLDTRLDVSGNLDKPVVSGSLSVNDKTDFTVVLPQPDPGIADREGIVEFVDRDNPQLDEPLMTAVDSLRTSTFKGMDIDVNIEVDKEATLSLVIDKGSGDYLQLKGEARLNGGIDPSGKTNLTGRYELKEGFYEMSFNLIKRKFEIDNGSYLLWTGDPTSANINIVATYTANTAPIDLVGDQLGSVSPSVRNTYKQRLPFQAKLKMTGELLKPEISFDIVLPEKNYGVSSDIVDASRTKLEQLRQEPAELNKQVFALLLLNRFIGENPFASESGGISGESFARQSVSKILSEQLNNIAADLVTGFEVNFDLESSEDYTTGQRENRTDLNVDLSKRLLNDRLKVTLGSSFGLEGPQQANQQTTNIAGDISAEYQLTKDGRYAVRAYRKNEYEIALQGQVIETGVAFIITMDYNRFRELFHKSEEEKRMEREQEREKRRKAEAEARKNRKSAQDTDTKTEQDDSDD